MHKHKAIFLILLIQLASLTSCFAWSQPIDLRQSPPPIAFDDWHAIEEHHYTLRIPSARGSGYASNDSFAVHAFLPPGSVEKVPVVVMLHYWGATDLKSEAALASKLNRSGIAAIALELPYHLSRAPEGTRSGELAIQPDPDKLILTMDQAVSDIRRTIDWISTRAEFDSERVGLVGTSLGSIVGALSFAVEPRIKSYCSVLGGASLAEILWGSSRLVREREQLRRKGYRRDSLAKALLPIEPAEYLSPQETRPTYLITARYDTVIPSNSSKSLQKALPNSAQLWLETGHYGGFFVQSSVLKTVEAFFAKSLQGEAYSAPKRLYSPTLRLSAITDQDEGLNVALGLDVWHPRADGKLFGAVLITPTGFRGFIGTKFSTGLALGVQIQHKRTSPAALWSFVL